MCGRGLHVANSILVITFFAAHKFGLNALSTPVATDRQQGHWGSKGVSVAGADIAETISLRSH